MQLDSRQEYAFPEVEWEFRDCFKIIIDSSSASKFTAFNSKANILIFNQNDVK